MFKVFFNSWKPQLKQEREYVELDSKIRKEGNIFKTRINKKEEIIKIVDHIEQDREYGEPDIKNLKVNTYKEEFIVKPEVSEKKDNSFKQDID